MREIYQIHVDQNRASRLKITASAEIIRTSWPHAPEPSLGQTAGFNNAISRSVELQFPTRDLHPRLGRLRRPTTCFRRRPRLALTYWYDSTYA